MPRASSGCAVVPYAFVVGGGCYIGWYGIVGHVVVGVRVDVEMVT